MIWLLLLAPLALAWLLWRQLKKRQTRNRLLSMDLTDRERAIIAEAVPLTTKLPKDLRPAFEGRMNVFLEQVTFHGYEGLELTEEMQLSIAAQACLLVVNSPSWYENLRTILVYPTAFRSKQHRREGHVMLEQETVMLGQSWSRGPVVLSWAHSKQGALNDEDGHNVVLHEFAHQLDDLTGRTNGLPILRKGQSFARWEKAMLDAFNKHVALVEKGRKTFIDPYGATGHEEFFAEAVVVFFEKPAKLQLQEPALYEELATLLGLDPATWT